MTPIHLSLYKGRPRSKGVSTRRQQPPHSVRNACNGSMREARRAGTYAATSATAQSSKLTPEKTTGFVGVVPNSRDSIHLLNAKEPSVPSATPARARSSVLMRTPRRTSEAQRGCENPSPHQPGARSQCHTYTNFLGALIHRTRNQRVNPERCKQQGEARKSR